MVLSDLCKHNQRGISIPWEQVPKVIPYNLVLKASSASWFEQGRKYLRKSKLSPCPWCKNSSLLFNWECLNPSLHVPSSQKAAARSQLLRCCCPTHLSSSAILGRNIFSSVSLPHFHRAAWLWAAVHSGHTDSPAAFTGKSLPVFQTCSMALLSTWLAL